MANFNLIVWQEDKKYKNEKRTLTNVTFAITVTTFDNSLSVGHVIVFDLDLLKILRAIAFIFHIVPSNQSLGIKNTD